LGVLTLGFVAPVVAAHLEDRRTVGLHRRAGPFRPMMFMK
jgi:hypothetical protein